MMQTTLISVASPTSSPRPTPMHGAEQLRPDPVRIAIVDDDALFRESLGGNLADEGYRILSFADGRSALDHFARGGTVDVVLLDWRMPGMDGIELLRELRGRGFEVPVIFLTVLSDDVYEEAALAGGAVDFVEKSRSLPILLNRIRLTTERHRAGEGAPVATPVAANAEAPAAPAGRRRRRHLASACQWPLPAAERRRRLQQLGVYKYSAESLTKRALCLNSTKAPVRSLGRWDRCGGAMACRARTPGNSCIAASNCAGRCHWRQLKHS
jgi:DNA-binding response OmpR family regulator